MKWQSAQGFYTKDEKAFVFSVDKKLTFKATDPQRAVYMSSQNGPSFGGNSLDLHKDPMNTVNGGWCWTNGKIVKDPHNNYKIPVDEEGKSVLTGDGAGMDDAGKWFTCAELEVFLISY